MKTVPARLVARDGFEKVIRITIEDDGSFPKTIEYKVNKPLPIGTINGNRLRSFITRTFRFRKKAKNGKGFTYWEV